MLVNFWVSDNCMNFLNKYNRCFWKKIKSKSLDLLIYKISLVNSKGIRLCRYDKVSKKAFESICHTLFHHWIIVVNFTNILSKCFARSFSVPTVCIWIWICLQNWSQNVDKIEFYREISVDCSNQHNHFKNTTPYIKFRLKQWLATTLLY